jgi:hypothetical protein
MALTITQEQINRSLKTKQVDNFYVSFYNFPGNISNLLGRQVSQLERPSVTFRTFTTEYKGTTLINNAQFAPQPVTITFFDDDASLTTQLLYEQIFRQTGKTTPDLQEKNFNSAQLMTRTFDKSKFTIGVKVYGSEDKLVEQYAMLGCFIVGITHSQHIMKSTDYNMVTCSISFDDLEFYNIDASNPFAAFETPSPNI